LAAAAERCGVNQKLFRRSMANDGDFKRELPVFATSPFSLRWIGATPLFGELLRASALRSVCTTIPGSPVFAVFDGRTQRLSEQPRSNYRKSSAPPQDILSNAT
jgi:hypothetical protein